MTAARVCAICCATFAALAVWSLSARADPGAPPPGSGDLDAPNHVRIIDGDSIDAIINGNRVAIGIIGIRAPQGNTKCGRESKSQLKELERLARARGGGPRFVEDRDLTYDERGRRMYYFEEKAGKSLAREMVKGGWAHADGRGKEKDQVKGDEDEARRQKRGCLWRDGAASPSSTISASSPAAGGLQAAPGTADPGTTASRVGSDRAGASSTAAALALPSGFSQDTVASGLGTPTAFAFLPGGRILVAQQNGVVRLVKDGVLQSAPFVDISSKVNDYWDRGLLGIAADANFSSNGYVYLLHTYEDDPATYNGPKTSRLTRVTANGDTAVPGSEVTILGTVGGSSCKAFPVGADCIPSDYFSHSVGSVKSASDGSLFLTVGESASFNVVNDDALRAQDLKSLAGKVLHVTSAGKGLPSNPFYTGNADDNASKVWAYGLRNPYRMNLAPGTNTPFLGDVGWDTWEEIDVAAAGANLGWPCYEGSGRQSGYEPKATCQALYAKGAGAVRSPLTTWNHNGSSAASTGGAFYTGSTYPATYQGAYFYGDYAAGFIRYLKVDANDQLVGGPTDFTIGGNPVDVEMGPEGNLYALDIFAGELRRFRYGPPQIPPPPAASAYLSDLTPISAVSGWGPVERDMSNGEQAAGDGVPMRIQGSDFARGLGVHANSDVSFNLGGKCTRFTAQFGADDEAGDAEPSMSYAVVADDATLTSGSVTGSTTARTVSVDVTNRSELSLRVTDGGNGNGNDHADWGDAFLECSGATPPPPSGVSYVSDLTPTSSVNGWGPMELDRSNGEELPGDGRTLTIRGTTFTKGLGVHADSDVRYSLGRACTSFTAQVGIDDEAGATWPSVTFQVSADGVPLYDSGVVDGATGARSVSVDVTGRSTLALVVTNVDGNSLDHADWADAKLSCSGGNTPPTVSIASPAQSAQYKVGDVISYAGSATDAEDGSVPVSRLSWKILSHHCPGGSCHVHTIDTQAGVSGGSFVVPDHGDDSYLELALTATDAAGAASTTTVTMRPRTVNLTFATSPAGLQVVYDGTTYTTPTTKATIVGSQHTIQTSSPQGNRLFSSWSDGGAQQHDVVVGDADRTYTARFATDTTPPTITTVSPASGATNVPVTTNVSSTFSEPMGAATVTSATVRLVVKGTTALVAATVAYDAASRTATLRPSSALRRGTAYTVTVRGGSVGVKDVAGNALATTRTWSFTTQS